MYISDQNAGKLTTVDDLLFLALKIGGITVLSIVAAIFVWLFGERE